MSAMAENGFLVGFVKRGKMSSDITHHVNVSNAKLLAILLVVCLSGYQAALKVYEGEEPVYNLD